MGKPEVTPEQVVLNEMVAGFSLVEVLVSITVVTVVVVAVLQCMAFSLQISQSADKQWRESLSKWNQVQVFRSHRGTQGEPTVVFPGARPMSYLVVESEQEDDAGDWKVLRADK